MAPKDPSIIALQVNNMGQLFNTLDPMPFRDRDLDSEAEEYIVGWARELPRDAPIQIAVHLPVTEAASDHVLELGTALNRYFRYRADYATGDLKELFRVGRYSLLVGLAVLATCLTVGRLLSRLGPGGNFQNFINEGLIILGWVANWKPLEIFLYDWWPIVRRRALFARLATANVAVVPKAEILPP